MRFLRWTINALTILETWLAERERMSNQKKALIVAALAIAGAGIGALQWQ